MQVTRQHVVDILRITGLSGLAEEARRLLPDPVEYTHAEQFLAQYGVTKDELISRRGGSPLPMTDDDLRHNVAAELCWDPRVDSAAIEVSAASGVVTLRGTVASLGHKRAGGNAAARVRGVTRVANELRVQLADGDQRDDEDLRGDVLEALMLEGSVPMTVDAQARDGFVTLTGAVKWHYQREAAESRTAGVPGVVDIDNAIALAQAPDARAAADAIGCAFRRDAVLDADGLSVEAHSGGLVILSGTVSSCAAHDHAVAAAWSAAGVTDVEDRIDVENAPQRRG